MNMTIKLLKLPANNGWTIVQWNYQWCFIFWYAMLTHCGRVMHICVSELTIIGSDNGLSPGQRQAIIWTNAGILLIGPSEISFSEIWIEIQIFSFRKMHLKMSSAKWRPFCLSLNVLSDTINWTCTGQEDMHMCFVVGICLTCTSFCITMATSLFVAKHQ